MAAARYWRIVGLETYAGGDLELSELHLYGASGRLDATATLTSTIAPTAGTLAALQDDNLGTTCRFAAAAVRAGGFAIAWDFGAGNTADGVGLRLGASADQSAFMAGCTLQYSTDGAQWQWLAEFARYAWPGVGAYTVAPTVGDPDYAKVSLLLHGDGADGSTAFTDSSQTPKVVSVASGAPRISTAQSKFGGASVHTNGGSIKATIPPLALRDFTVEFFVLRVTGTDRALFDIGNNQLLLLQGSTGLRLYDGGTVIPSATMLSTSFMEHVALVRQSGAFKLFHQGVLLGSATKAINFASGLFTLGGWNAYASENLNGYFDEVRITDGVARYTANFTPPTGPFLNSAGGSGGTVFGSPILHTAPVRASIAASAPVPPHGTPLAPRLRLARDVEHGGPGTIYGTTKTKGTPNLPTKARVVLQHQRSKLPVRETWSDPVTGAFVFSGIDTSQQFLALAEDAAGNFRPVAANRLTPEVLA